MVLKVVVEVLEKSLKELEFNVQITVGTLCSVEFHKGLLLPQNIVLVHYGCCFTFVRTFIYSKNEIVVVNFCLNLKLSGAIIRVISFYPHDVVSAVYATATWLGDWMSCHTLVLYQNG